MRIRVLPLALLLIGAQPSPPGSAIDWAAAETIEVKLSNFAFNPARLTLHHGRPYRLRLVNAASGGHNFSAPALFTSSTLAPGEQVQGRGGKIEVPKHEVRELRFVPLRVGTYKIKCTHFMHSGLGMKGEAVVD